ncbi:MAG: BON domain-containing protein [Burkholderiales bacterium]|nr:BON domain-containing protein [Burkholderiales bacterium]
MKPVQQKSLLAVSALAALLALGGCNRTTDGTVNEPTASTSPATTPATTTANAPSSSNTDTSLNNAADATRTAGASGGTTLGEKLDDAGITAKVNAGLAADSDLSAIKINVDTKDGVVTLNGPAPTAAAKDRATEIAKNIKGVSSVNNQLAVRG